MEGGEKSWSRGWVAGVGCGLIDNRRVQVVGREDREGMTEARGEEVWGFGGVEEEKDTLDELK